MATLKISDLSVGDWVRYRDREWEVCSIYQFTEEVGLFRKDSQICESIEDIESIPITAEILEKNGWRVIEKELFGDEYEYDGEERVWDDENCTIEICEARQGIFWYSWRSEYYMWRLEYVHQLQHLVRLAGVEKEINL